MTKHPPAWPAHTHRGAQHTGGVTAWLRTCRLIIEALYTVTELPDSCKPARVQPVAWYEMRCRVMVRLAKHSILGRSNSCTSPAFTSDPAQLPYPKQQAQAMQGGSQQRCACKRRLFADPADPATG